MLKFIAILILLQYLYKLIIHKANGMKKIFFFLSTLFFPLLLHSQLPEKMSYQSIIRNSSNNLVINQTVSIRIQILQGSINGTAVFVETHSATTNINGLASIQIGGGILVSGNFSGINWANGPYFLKTETDPGGGSNYSISSTSQLISVPYAFMSGNGIRGVSSTGDTLFLGNGSHLIVPGISVANNAAPFDGSHNCGADSIHKVSLNYGNMIDQDGNTYRTIIIGTQEWMAENLKASHYRNGSLIPMVSSNTDWQNTTGAAAAWYSNDSNQFACPYGKLYNWQAVNDPANLCPSGWHLPSDLEWNIMVSTIDPALILNTYGPQSAFAGGQLKSASLQYWLSTNASADNAAGFSAIGGGFRDVNGSFSSIRDFGFYWSSTPDLPNTAIYHSFYSSFDQAFRDGANKQVGMSVRCVKD